jgi:hypothetical protein
MWPFKRKKNPPETAPQGPACTFCRSTNTIVISLHGSDTANPVRTWRGQRYLTCRCRDCGQDFYVAEGAAGAPPAREEDERLVDNADELQAAEEELKKEIREKNDRMFG